MSFQFMALYTGDYRRDTQHLSMMEHGCYLLMLMHSWDQRGPLPLDERRIFAICNARSNEEMGAARNVLSEFFVRMSDGHYNRRMQREIERAQAISGARSNAGKLGQAAKAKHLPSKCSASDKQVPLPPPPPPPLQLTPEQTISTAAQSHPAKPRKRGSAGGVGFDLLWAQYPKKQSKAAAIKAFDKLAPSADLLDDLLQAVAKQRAWPQWTREGGQFVPMLATWINNRRWEDELARHGHESSETPRQRAARARVAEMTGGLMGSEPYQPRGSDYDEMGGSFVHAPVDAIR
jgi:uncharacterized protein YdaU (DUF1376 family)